MVDRPSAASAAAVTHSLNLGTSALAGAPASAGTFSVRVHPVVLFAVLDHFLRRDDSQDRVIGTLLGSRSEDGSEVDIKSCFPVPHTEFDNQVAVDMEYHQNMYELLRRVNHNEVILGWYATGNELSKHSPLIQDFYSREAAPFQAIHLTIDTSLTNGRLDMRAFVSSPVGIVHRAESCIFLPIPCEVKYHDAERSGLEYLSAAKDKPSRTVSLISDMENLERSIIQLQQMLERVISYVEGVVEGKTPSDKAIGRFLLNSVAAIPKVDAKTFEQVFNGHMQDILMVVYLSSLMRNQMILAQRLERIV